MSLDYFGFVCFQHLCLCVWCR